MVKIIFNLPNSITLFRLILTAVICLLAAVAPDTRAVWEPGWLAEHGEILLKKGAAGISQLFREDLIWYNATLILFILTALTDWLDGYLARKYKLETKFGRIMDPVVDKTLVFAGFLVIIAKNPHLMPFWVVIVCLVREFVGTGLRTAVESEGKAFGAQWSGKLKTVAQFVTISWCLLHLGNGGWITATGILQNLPANATPAQFQEKWEFFATLFRTLDQVFVYAMLAIVLYSLVDYVWRGVQLLKTRAS